jgi:hypothetical protein
VNGKPPISPDSFDEIVSIIEEGRKRRLLLEHKDVTASNGGQRTLPSLSCQAKRNNFKVKSLSMDAFSSEPHLHQQQQGHQQLPDSWRGTLPIKRNQMMRKSRTELWSPPGTILYRELLPNRETLAQSDSSKSLLVPFCIKSLYLIKRS